MLLAPTVNLHRSPYGGRSFECFSEDPLLPWADEVAAVLLAWFPGQEFGNALADVLLGLAEPGGRLPTSWPVSEEGLPSTRPVDGTLRYDEGLFIGYRCYDRTRRTPRYCFGHGLGYTTWEYLGVAATATDATVRLRNSGSRPGREVVQVYVSRTESAVERPVRWLAGFATVDVPTLRRPAQRRPATLHGDQSRLMPELLGAYLA